ncbi:wax ester synthase-like Acyl-CoA acyltransferase domain protein [Mycobacterium xenopi 3993]|nr:wax ester synthase-like Acyl-CoA acyltransferase domain protein [Mycobacterium xenopi 3993]
MDNVLDPLDQLTFDAERVTGVASIPHPFWIYNRPVDVDGLRKFHHHLQRGWLNRRIEPSPLRFGRHRWVLDDNPSDIEIVATPRPRAELDAWLEEQAATPIDAERGPGWHLAMLPFTDGGAAVSLTVSHCLADGLGLLEAMGMRPMLATPRSAGPMPGRADGGRPYARTSVNAYATCLPSDVPLSRRCVWPGMPAIRPEPHHLPHHLGCRPMLTNP